MAKLAPSAFIAGLIAAHNSRPAPVVGDVGYIHEITGFDADGVRATQITIRQVVLFTVMAPAPGYTLPSYRLFDMATRRFLDGARVACSFQPDTRLFEEQYADCEIIRLG